MNTIETSVQRREPWNKGKLTGQKAPLRLRDIWAIRICLQLARKVWDLALFDLAIDSKLRACDLVKLRVRDVGSADHISSRTIVLQQKTQRPVQFKIAAPPRDAVSVWIKQAQLQSNALSMQLCAYLPHRSLVAGVQLARSLRMRSCEA